MRYDLSTGARGALTIIRSMFESYRDSVLDATDDDGLLSPADSRKLVTDHQCEWSEWIKECPMGTNPRDAHEILCWLGH